VPAPQIGRGCPCPERRRTLISRTGLHAIRALAELARSPTSEFVDAGRLAAATGAPPNYLGKLLQSMAVAGFVESRKGARGGFRLARPPESIRLADVLEPIDRPSDWQGCFLGRPTCSADSPCAVHSRWEALRDAYLALLSETTIAGIVDSVRSPARAAETAGSDE